MLNLIHNCSGYMKCRSANVLGIGLRLGPPQLSAWISTHMANVCRDQLPPPSTQAQCPLGLGIGLHSCLVSSQPTELMSPRNLHLKPDLHRHTSLYLFTNLVEPCSIVADKFLPTRVVSEFPSYGRRDLTLPPCFEKSLDNDQNETPFNSIQLPPVQGTYKKHAARLIVIRKRKMKKHKLQKLRKKMKFEWAKVRQGREMRKEKAFQAELLAQIKEANKFDAAQYVAEKLRKAYEVPIPKTWKGKRLPEFIIKEKLGLK